MHSFSAYRPVLANTRIKSGSTGGRRTIWIRRHSNTGADPSPPTPGRELPRNTLKIAHLFPWAWPLASSPGTRYTDEGARRIRISVEGRAPVRSEPSPRGIAARLGGGSRGLADRPSPGISPTAARAAFPSLIFPHELPRTGRQVSMAVSYTQDRRLLTVTSVLGDNVLLLQSFTGQEAISNLFSYELNLFSDNESIAAKDLVGTSITWAVNEVD